MKGKIIYAILFAVVLIGCSGGSAGGGGSSAVEQQDRITRMPYGLPGWRWRIHKIFTASAGEVFFDE